MPFGGWTFCLPGSEINLFLRELTGDYSKKLGRQMQRSRSQRQLFFCFCFLFWFVFVLFFCFLLSTVKRLTVILNTNLQARASFLLVLVHNFVLEQICSHESGGLNARKQLLHNFYTFSVFRKILNLLKVINIIYKIFIFESATLFFPI